MNVVELNFQALEREILPTELAAFRSYSLRVKHIAHSRNIRIHPLALSFLVSHNGDTDLLPNLTTVQVSSAASDEIQTSLSVSPKLRFLDLDLGFKAKTQAKVASASTVCEYLKQVTRVAPNIERISLRGRASEQLNQAVSLMTKLRVLSLRAGTSLAGETLGTVSFFPSLTDLEIHASHIEVEDLAATMASHCTPTFLSLRKFHIRAHTPLIEFLLCKLQPDTLHILHIEVENSARSPISWDRIINIIRIKASQSLQELTLEHHIDIDNLEDTQSASSSPLWKSNNNLTINTLHPLARLPHIRRFIIDTTLPPDLCDSDIEHIAKWWPGLEHLDLGPLPVLECVGQKWQPRTTIASLAMFARYTPRLESLILPLDVASGVTLSDGELLSTVLCQSVLRRLTISSTTPPDSLSMARYLRHAFPSVVEVDGTAEHEEEWKQVRMILQEEQEGSIREQHGLLLEA